MYKMIVTGFDGVLVDDDLAISLSTMLEIDRIRRKKMCLPQKRRHIFFTLFCYFFKANFSMALATPSSSLEVVI